MSDPIQWEAFSPSIHCDGTIFEVFHRFNVQPRVVCREQVGDVVKDLLHEIHDELRDNVEIYHGIARLQHQAAEPLKKVHGVLHVQLC